MSAGCYISLHTAARVRAAPHSLSAVQVSLPVVISAMLEASPSSMHSGHHFPACHFQMPGTWKREPTAWNSLSLDSELTQRTIPARGEGCLNHVSYLASLFSDTDQPRAVTACRE